MASHQYATRKLLYPVNLTLEVHQILRLLSSGIICRSGNFQVTLLMNRFISSVALIYFYFIQMPSFVLKLDNLGILIHS